jgi:hypothetical protein
VSVTFLGAHSWPRPELLFAFDSNVATAYQSGKQAGISGQWAQALFAPGLVTEGGFAQMSGLIMAQHKDSPFQQ